MINSPIFIVGCDRSGTTLLRLMLNQSSQLHIPVESGFLPELKANQEIYGDFTQAYQRYFFIRDLQTNKATSQTYSFSVFQLTVEEAEMAIIQAAPTNYPSAANALFKACAEKQGKERWGDKTPRYIFDLPWLAKAFPDAKFIHIIRDGRDVGSSLIKAGWITRYLQAAEYWQKRVEAGRVAGQHLGHDKYYELHYEQLITDPETTLKNLCRWLELEYTEKMLHYYETSNDYIKKNLALHQMVAKPLDPSKVYSWKKKLSSREIADFESVSGELLAELGYELKNYKIPIFLRLFRSMVGFLRSNTRQIKPYVAKYIK